MEVIEDLIATFTKLRSKLPHLSFKERQQARTHMQNILQQLNEYDVHAFINDHGEMSFHLEVN